LEVEFKRDERIMRFLTVRMDKYGIEYAARLSRSGDYRRLELVHFFRQR
jgi:small subunit ribosomal protein S6